MIIFPSSSALAYLGATVLIGSGSPAANAQGQMVKMCLFYDRPSGHARSDPIINQSCASDHVHTFYGPLNFHPNTIYDEILKTPPEYSTSPFVENQSLYWHPSIYEVTNNGDGTETFTRVSNLDTSPYYRWDNSVMPLTEAFPPGFRMIAANTDPGANLGGEIGVNLFTECCDLVDGEEDCVSWAGLKFPQQSCDFVGIAMNMPTCWNGELGDKNDHKNHMAYTTDGAVAGDCPFGFSRRLPQVQLFVRINNYKGGKYQLSDGNVDKWHVDFFGGWEVGKLDKIIKNCPIPSQEVGDFNPACGCTFSEGDTESFLTPNENVSKMMCDSDVRRLIIDEATDVTKSLPRGTCKGPNLIAKSWDELTNDLYMCAEESFPTASPIESPDDECVESKKAKFFLKNKKKNGVVVGFRQKSCGWLEKKKKKTGKKHQKLVKKICKRKNGYEDDEEGIYLEPAREVCMITCTTCEVTSGPSDEGEDEV